MKGTLHPHPLRPRRNTASRPSTSNVRCSTFDVRCSTFEVGSSTFEVQRSTFTLQRSPFSLPHFIPSSRLRANRPLAAARVTVPRRRHPALPHQRASHRGWLCLAVALLCLLTAPSRAGDWRQFRGPDAKGIVADATLPVNLDPNSHVAWKIALPGRGLSSPIIVGDRIFVTAASGPQQKTLHVICLRASDGRKLWERRFQATGRTMTHEKTSVAAPTPVSDGRHLFALFSSNDLLCLDLDGNLVWMRGLTLDYPNASNSLGMASSPVVQGQVLVVQIENDSESFAAGIDTATGHNRWKLNRPKSANWTSPILLTDPATAKPVVALQSSTGIDAVDPLTGRTVWSFGDGASTIPSSAGGDQVLYVPSNGLTALQPDPASSQPRQLWNSRTLRPATASPVLWQDRILVLNSAGVLNCGDAKDGSRLWQLRLEGPFSATPVGAGHHLFCVNEQGQVQVVDLSAPEGSVVSSLDLGETILGTPSIALDAIFFRSDGHLWKIAAAL